MVVCLKYWYYRLSQVENVSEDTFQLANTVIKATGGYCRYKLGTPIFGEFLPFFSADPLKLCQFGWEALLHSYFQVSPAMFDQVLSPGSGWVTQVHSETCPEATPALLWLCA